jgi:hypothetical protein
MDPLAPVCSVRDRYDEMPSETETRAVVCAEDAGMRAMFYFDFPSALHISRTFHSAHLLSSSAKAATSSAAGNAVRASGAPCPAHCAPYPASRADLATVLSAFPAS